MNQLVENLVNISPAPALSYCEHVRNLISSISCKHEVDARTATLYGIIGCLCIWIICISKRKPTRPITKPKSPQETRCYRLGELHGGDRVLHRLEQVNEAKANPAVLANTENLLKALLEEEHLDLMKLQQTVAKLEMSGSEDSAVKILRDAVKKARDKNKAHEAYEIEMLLVEMIIYKGEFKDNDSLKFDCLEHQSIKDERRPLYKAIIHKMMKDTEKANEFWKEFIEVRDPCLCGALHETHFHEFEKLVDKLQETIQKKNPFK